VHTLPTLYALADQDPADPDGKRLRELLGRPITDDDEVTEALTLLRESSALPRARKTLSDYADQAREVLRALPDSPAREALRSMADYLVDRTG
jgi:heptaprenyl diphosphate synthase